MAAKFGLTSQLQKEPTLRPPACTWGVPPAAGEEEGLVETVAETTTATIEDMEEDATTTGAAPPAPTIARGGPGGSTGPDPGRTPREDIATEERITIEQASSKYLYCTVSCIFLLITKPALLR